VHLQAPLLGNIGRGLLHVIEDYVHEQLDDGRIGRALDAWCPSFPGFCLYTASRALLPLNLRALINFLKDKRGAR